MIANSVIEATVRISRDATSGPTIQDPYIAVDQCVICHDRFQ